MAIDPAQLAALFGNYYQDDEPTPPSYMGMMGAATPLSIFLNPPKRGEHRVGALGSQLGQLSPKTLQSLFPIAMGRYQQRQGQEAEKIEDRKFFDWASTLPPEQQEKARQLRYAPKEVLQAQELAGEAQKQRAEKDWWREQQDYQEGQLRERQRLDDERAAEVKAAGLKRVREGLEGTAKPLPQSIREMASAIGKELPENVIVLPTPGHKKEWEKIVGGGLPDSSVITEEDATQIAQEFESMQAGIGMLPKKPLEVRMPAVWPFDGAAFSFDNVMKDPAMEDHFRNLVKLYTASGHKDAVSKAWNEVKDDAKAAAKDKETLRKEGRTDLVTAEKEERTDEKAFEKEMVTDLKALADSEGEWKGLEVAIQDVESLLSTLTPSFTESVGGVSETKPNPEYKEARTKLLDLQIKKAQAAAKYGRMRSLFEGRYKSGRRVIDVPGMTQAPVAQPQPAAAGSAPAPEREYSIQEKEAVYQQISAKPEDQRTELDLAIMAAYEAETGAGE